MREQYELIFHFSEEKGRNKNLLRTKQHSLPERSNCIQCYNIDRIVRAL